MEIQVSVYGQGTTGITLYEDDDATYAYRRGKFQSIELTYDAATQKGKLTRKGAA